MGLFTIIAAVVSFALSYTQAKKAQRQAQKAADAMKGVLINKESNIEPIPVVYGTRRVGGTRVYVQAEGGNKNKYLYICLAMAEGEVSEIYDIEIDDYDLFGGRYGFISTTQTDEYVEYSSSDDLVRIQAFYGKDTQAASSILKESSKWTNNHRLQGVSYLAISLKWDEDIFSGMPDITAVVQGKKVYDPRSGLSIWSDNPSLCLLDYLRNNRHGKGLPDSVIDFDSFEEAATYCESTSVRTNTGDFEQEQLFRCNFVLQTGDKIFENVQKFLLGCRGFLPYTNGKYSLVIDRPVSNPALEIGINEIIGGIGIAGESKKDRFNRVQVKFPNPKADWQPDEAIWPDAGSQIEADYLAEDGGELLVDEIDMEMITSYYAARDFARIFLLRSRNALRAQITCTSEAIDLVPSDLVTVTHPTPGWNGKPFQVEEMSLNFDGTVDLQLIEYDPSIYSYDISNPEGEYPDTDLPNPFDIEPPTELRVVESTEVAADGTLIVALDVSWTASENSFTTFYEIGWYEGTGSIVFTDTLNYTGSTTRSTSYRITNISQANLTIGVRAVSTEGAKSGWVYREHLIAGDETAPDVISANTCRVVGGLKQIELSWVNPTQFDLHYLEIEQNSNFAGGQSAVWNPLTLVSAPNNSFVHTGLDFDARRSYRIRPVDYSGNEADWTFMGSATALGVDSDEFKNSITKIFEDADLQGIPFFNSSDDFPTVDNEIGDVIFNLDDKQLYHWTSSGWQTVVPDVTKLVGELPSTVEIADDFIKSPMIAAGQITAAKIYSGNVTADRIQTNNIAAGAIEASLIAATAIQTKFADINEALIRNVHIENGAITTVKIGRAQIDTLRIQDEAVTIPEFAERLTRSSDVSGGDGEREFQPFTNYLQKTVFWTPDSAANALITNGVIRWQLFAGAVVSGDPPPVGYKYQIVFMQRGRSISLARPYNIAYEYESEGDGTVYTPVNSKFVVPNEGSADIIVDKKDDLDEIAGSYDGQIAFERERNALWNWNEETDFWQFVPRFNNGVTIYLRVTGKNSGDPSAVEGVSEVYVEEANFTILGAKR